MANTKTASLVTITDLTDAPIGILSNESFVLAADLNGVVGSFSGASTTLSIKLGGADDSANWSVSAGTPVGIAGSLSGKTYTVTAMSADVGYVDLTASRAGFSNIVKRFSVAKAKQGTSGVSITGTLAEYKLSSSGTTTPSSWDATASAQTTSLPFLWTRIKISYSNGSSSYVYTVSKMGDTGGTGPQGVSVSSITPYYRTVTKGAQAPAAVADNTVPPAPWQTTEPTYTANTDLYRTDRVLFSNGNSSCTAVTKVSTWEAVNNISIGGRNLILQSDTVRNSVTATLQTYNISEAFTSRVYTFSMRVVGATGTTYTLKQNNGTTSLGSLVADANGIFSLTFASSQTEEYLQTFLITQSPLPSEENSIIWAKLEYGNKYTDYTQAPEDIEAQINDLIERTNTNETDINRKITVFTGAQTPIGAKKGDIWINANDGDRQYIYGEGMWTLFGKTDLDLLNEQINALSSIAFGGANVYRQIAAPSSQHENDMWIDTDDNSKVYTYKGGNWVVVANFNNLLKMINDIDVSIKDGSTLSILLDSNSILQKLKDNLRLDSDYVKNTAEYDNLMRSISDGLQGLQTTVYGDPAVGIASLESLINAQKLDEGLKALLSGYNVYMRQAGQYPNDYLQIARKQGDIISPFEVRITNERIDFMYQGESVAHCSTSDFNMEIATIDQYSRHIYRNPATGAKVGEFQIIAVDGGLQGLWIQTTT